MTAMVAWKAPEMSQNPWGNSHKRFTPERAREEMRGHLRVIARMTDEPNRKAALAFAARVLEMPYWRVSEIFYGRARRIEAHEADRIRAFVWQADKVIKARAKLEAERRAFLAEAPAFMGRLAPAAIPEMAAETEATPAPVKRSRA